MKMLKRKTISLFLAFAMFVPCLSMLSEFAVFSLAEGSIDAPDVSVKYDIDSFYMNETSGHNSVSSGANNRWNQVVGVAMNNLTDPADPSNAIYSLTGANGYIRKIFYSSMRPTNTPIALYVDMKIPAPTDETDTQSVSAKLFGQTPLQLTYNASTSKFDGVYYGEKFSVAYDTWIRFYNIVTLNEGMTSMEITSQLSGQLMDDKDQPLSYLQKETVLNVTNDEFRLTVEGQDGKKGVLYLDNTGIGHEGDFGEATVKTEGYEDYYKNFNLSGDVKVQLYHTVDLSTFNMSDIRVCDKLSQPIPCTNVRLSHDARTLTFNFEDHKLPKFEDIYFCFGDNIRDMHGNTMYETTVIVKTLGDKGEVPAPPDVIEVPANGFVMPDQWNTGYRCDKSELVPFEEKYPEVVANGNIIDERIARLYNYEFSYFSYTKHLYVIATSPVYIHDFYMNGGGFSNGKSGKNTSSARLTIAWGEGEGSSGDYFGGSNMTIMHCYIHDIGADHMKGNTGQIVAFNYFRDGGTRNPGAHADVVQFMGDLNGKSAIRNAVFYGNRFDAPPMGYDHVANCCFFFKPESKSVGCVNIQSIGNWFNGGGYTTYLTPACDKSLCQQIYYNDNKWGYGHQFGPMNYDGKWVTDYNGTYENNGYVTELQVGSIVYYSVLSGYADRVYAAENISSTDARIMVNLANYMTSARGYSIVVEVLDKEGKVVLSEEKSGTIRRYVPVKEYMVSSNLRDTGLKNPENGGTIYELIEKPDLPHDVPEYIDLTGLPSNMEDHSISVKVYDITSGKKLIRTSHLGLDVYDDCRPNEQGEQDTYYSVTFKDTNGNVFEIQSVKAGEDAVSPEPPVKEGFVFVGWSDSITNVQSNITVTAKYKAEETPVYYSVKFMDLDGNILSDESVLKGTSATAPTPPEIAGYEFIGWSENFSNVRSDMIILPQYQKIDTRSQALKAFEQSVILVENAAKSSLSVRLSKLQAAYNSWSKVDSAEEGANEVYARFEKAMLAYNQDVERYNDIMDYAEKVSQASIKSPIN